MKQFIAFVQKEFHHILRDRRTILILLVMPIAQIILFGFALTTEVRNAGIVVLDPSKDEATRQITEKLGASEYFSIIAEMHSPSEVDEAFRQGQAQLAVIFSENFEENLMHTGEAAIQLITDATDPNQARTLTGYAQNIINQWKIENGKLKMNNSPNFQFSIFNSQLKMLYNPQMKGAYNFVPGVMGLILMLICAMMTSISIVREKETGTMEVLLASPMKPIYIILAKVTPYFVLSALNLATILLLSFFVLDVPIAGNLLLLTILSLVFILVALSLGILISNVVETQVAAMLISGLGLLMPTMLLSGLIFPIESMPEILQWISAVLPVRWFIEAVRKVMIQGVGIQFIAKELIILTGMAFFLLTVSLKRYKVRLE